MAKIKRILRKSGFVVLTALALAPILIWAGANASAQTVIDSMAIDLKPMPDSSEVALVYAIRLQNPGTEAVLADWQLPVPAGARLEGIYRLSDTGTVAMEGARLQAVDTIDVAAVHTFSGQAVNPGEDLTAVVMYRWDGLERSTEIEGGTRLHLHLSMPYDLSHVVLKVTEPPGSQEVVIRPTPAFQAGEARVVDIIPIEDVRKGDEITVDVAYIQQAASTVSAPAASAPPAAAEDTSNLVKPRAVKKRTSFTILSGIAILGLGLLLWKGTVSARKGDGGGEGA